MARGSFRSVVEMFRQRVDSTPESDALQGLRGEQWYTLRWREVGERARAIAGGLIDLGLAPGEPCALLSRTRPEWVIADYGILSAGGVTCGLYPADTPENWRWILEDSGARFAFAEGPEQAAVLLELGVEAVIQFKGRAIPGALDLDTLARKGRELDRRSPGLLDERAEAVGPDALASLIYTAGTTGRPKGVMLTHDCWVYEAEAVDAAGLLRPSDRQLLFLPLAHAFARVLAIAFVRMGVTTALHHRLTLDALSAVRPTVLGGVPRTYEKLQEQIEGWADRGPVRSRALSRIRELGARSRTLEAEGRRPGARVALERAALERTALPRVRALLGGEIRYMISGGAPLPIETARFFDDVGLPVLEGYGLTESSAASCVNLPDRSRLGTVGPPLPGTELRIAPDGEVLIRGRGVMKGYLHRPEDTAEILQDGWLSTGDLGQLQDGFLTITGRKKELIVTSGGKNIAPRDIEAALARDPLIRRAVIFGDRRPWCVALLELDPEEAAARAAALGAVWAGYADLAAIPALRDAAWARVQEINRDLASFETIRAIHLLPGPLSAEAGELTPTGEVKRQEVEMRYKDALRALYAP